MNAAKSKTMKYRIYGIKLEDGRKPNHVLHFFKSLMVSKIQCYHPSILKKSQQNHQINNTTCQITDEKGVKWKKST